jgi:hypothetical protein
LDIDALSVAITPAAGATAGQFNFNLTNTASLDGAAIGQNSCSGTAPGTGTCGSSGGALVLDANPANGIGSDLTRTNNSMTFFGPGTGGNYANSDSVINDAQLVGDASTDTDNIAEASLDSKFAGAASAEIQSNTGFTFTFDITAAGSLALNFLADPDLRALVSALDAGAAQANLNTSFTLQQDVDAAGGSLGFANWNPDGTAVNNCSVGGGVTCTETADTQDLNINVGSTTPGADNTHSFGAGDANFGDALTSFGIIVGNLDAGTWTLTLNEQKSVNLSRQQVPEPGILALVGIGLMGLGMSTYRRKRS